MSHHHPWTDGGHSCNVRSKDWWSDEEMILVLLTAAQNVLSVQKVCFAIAAVLCLRQDSPVCLMGINELFQKELFWKVRTNVVNVFTLMYARTHTHFCVAAVLVVVTLWGLFALWCCCCNINSPPPPRSVNAVTSCGAAVVLLIVLHLWGLFALSHLVVLVVVHLWGLFALHCHILCCCGVSSDAPLRSDCTVTSGGV